MSPIHLDLKMTELSNSIIFVIIAKLVQVTLDCITFTDDSKISIATAKVHLGLCDGVKLGLPDLSNPTSTLLYIK